MSSGTSTSGGPSETSSVRAEPWSRSVPPDGCWLMIWPGVEPSARVSVRTMVQPLVWARAWASPTSWPVRSGTGAEATERTCQPKEPKASTTISTATTASPRSNRGRRARPDPRSGSTVEAGGSNDEARGTNVPVPVVSSTKSGSSSCMKS